MYVELAIAGAAALVTISAAVQHFNTFLTRGLGFIFTDRSMPTRVEGFTGRSERTLRNNVESAAMFVPPAVLLVVLGETGGLAGLAAAAYLTVRTAYTFTYWVGLNRLRSMLWGIGMASIGVMLALTVIAVATGRPA